ncbi:unnamed protein product [Lampetra planeri]
MGKTVSRLHLSPRLKYAMPAGGHRTAVPTEPVRQLMVPPQILDRGGTGGSAAIAAEVRSSDPAGRPG